MVADVNDEVALIAVGFGFGFDLCSVGVEEGLLTAFAALFFGVTNNNSAN